MTTTTATETATFYFASTVTTELSFEAPADTDPEVILEAIKDQLCLDNRIDLPEGISLDCLDTEHLEVDFSHKDD